MGQIWEKEEHKKLLQKIKETLEDDKVPTPEIYEIVKSVHDWESDYLRYNLLPDALNYLKEKDEIEIAEKKREGGNPTHYWRLK